MDDLISRAAAIDHMKSMAGCATCKLRYEIQRWDYSHGGCEHTKPEGHVCMAFKGEGIAVWMVGSTGMCEAYTPKEG